DAETATAIAIESGSNLPILRNSGTINAVTANDEGSATAIVDRSGSLGVVVNRGAIMASGAASGSDRNVAIDLSTRGQDTAIRQLVAASGTSAPVISGDVRFGSGNDRFEIADGRVTGRTTFGAGNDRLLMSGDAVYEGSVSFGGQADVFELSDTARFSGDANFGTGAGTLTLSDEAIFSGRLFGAQNVDVTLEAGTLDVRGQTALSSLDVGEDGVLVATLDGETAQTTALQVSGEAAFEDGAQIRLRVTDLNNAVGTYDVVTAGSIVGGGDLEADDMILPFLFEGELAATATTISVEIERKAAEDLGLNRSGTAAFDALYEVLGEDDEIADVFLAADDAQSLGALVAQTLPDHAGGSFEGINRGIRTLNRHFIDPQPPFESEAGLRVISDLAYWGTSKDERETAPYDLNGYGARGGIEAITGIGAFGITTSYLWNDHDTEIGNEVSSETFEVGAHWRHTFGPVAAFARGSLGWADFEGTRIFVAGTGDDRIDDVFGSDWSGDFLAISGGFSVEGGSQFFFFRPSVTFDYLDLTEDAYTEVGDREAFELSVEERSSDELGMNLALALGADLFGMQRRDDFWLRLEAEGGWREILAGDLGETTARFGESDDAFTLRPEDNDGGWFARLKAYAGDGGYLIGGEVGAEEQFGEVGYSVRATLRFGW
ncbi:MAG: autotransporter outer membrane beta-barrel domain-containing protein, partial [Pseudomonadota bacterium]